MSQSQSIYDSPRLASSYAFHRPPVHPQIIQAVAAHVHLNTPLRRALDIGCGAGQSTAALQPLAEMVVGIEPIQAMLKHSRLVAPYAQVLVGQAERLPFSAEAFDLLTAAGSVNYADLELFLPEAARVLAPLGVLVIYDFSAGRRLHGSTLLEAWYAEFKDRFPASPGYTLDVRSLAYGAAGLRLEDYAEIEVAVPMNRDSYQAYVLSETRVESAIRRGVPEEQIRGWCRDGLAQVFGSGYEAIIFEAYIAYVRRDEARWP